jgi:hypothetical protein
MSNTNTYTIKYCNTKSNTKFYANGKFDEFTNSDTD